ncbi:GFA family protein [Sphingomonas sp. LB-2]|uniref:GFA family protein n=1 Tax=Sphingomonas caeni TaxID=2984949 RepID=UPI0022326482|nr:GFA family protein [Sphingomonas caeni]MCW3847214.1 GFA family protein [Sphingomonas caeni]
MIEGRCACGTVSYKLTAEPMIVHCCHCSWCQRETGSAFVLNAVVERSAVEVSGEPELVMTPSASGKGQEIARCPACRVALWSHYPGAGRKAAFLRVGAMAEPDACPPDVHIFTSTKQNWVALPEGAKAFAEFYNPAEVWPAEMRSRWAAMMAAA